FFVSSRRRHTRWPRDWSSDVCSSDLTPLPPTPAPPSDSLAPSVPFGFVTTSATQSSVSLSWNASTDNVGVAGYDVYENGSSVARSEERRVGKECGSGCCAASVKRSRR